MYRAFVYIAFLALCSAAPWGDWNSAQQQPQQTTAPQFQQQDQTDLVDTFGAGYSFFKKQPIVSRPLVQQQLAVSEQQVPITSFADTSNQWSDYTKASAFKQDQSAYGSSLGQVQPQQTLVRNVGNGYGQQQQEFQTVVQPVVRNLGNGYGQQQQQDLPMLVQKPIIRNLGNGYGQQQQDLKTFVQKPVIRNLDNGYGQQQQDLQILVPKPVIRNLDNGYGQQQQQQDFTTIIQKPIIRNLGNGYGQQQQQQEEFQTLVQPVVRNLGNGYGQQQELKTFVPKPVIRNLDNGYGQQQQQQDLQILVQPQQPIMRNLGNGYGQQQQQQQPVFSQQADFPRGGAGLMSSRLSQSSLQMSDNDSNGGW